MPSAIAVHPDNGDMYITDGPNARLLILDKDGKVKSLVELGKDFEQPEGISFSGGGDIFISNEGAKGKGNIIMIKINAAG